MPIFIIIICSPNKIFNSNSIHKNTIIFNDTILLLWNKADTEY